MDKDEEISVEKQGLKKTTNGIDLPLTNQADTKPNNEEQKLCEVKTGKKSLSRNKRKQNFKNLMIDYDDPDAPITEKTCPLTAPPLDSIEEQLAAMTVSEQVRSPKNNENPAKKTNNRSLLKNPAEKTNNRSLLKNPAEKTNNRSLLKNPLPKVPLNEVTNQKKPRRRRARKRKLPVEKPPSAYYAPPLPQTPKQRMRQDKTWLGRPPRPKVEITKTAAGLTLSWNMVGESEPIVRYEIFQYIYIDGVEDRSREEWVYIGEVAAMPLPIACVLTSFIPGHRYFFVIRAVDIRQRYGEFSTPRSIQRLK